MADKTNVSLFQPKARAKVIPSVGAIALSVPVQLGGVKHNIQLGINLIGAPVDALTDEPIDRNRLERALFEALTGDVQVLWSKDKNVVTQPLHKALAAAVIFKMKDTM